MPIYEYICKQPFSASNTSSVPGFRAQPPPAVPPAEAEEFYGEAGNWRPFARVHRATSASHGKNREIPWPPVSKAQNPQYQGLRFANSPQIDSNRYRSRPCPFTSTSANNAITSLKPCFMAKKKPNAPSATPPSLSHSSRCSPFRRKARRRRPHRPAHAARAAIPAAQAPARCGI